MSPEIRGKYPARHTAPMAIKIEDSNAVMLYIQYSIVHDEVRHAGLHTICLAAKDGTPQKNNIENVTKAFNLGDDIMDIQEIPVNTTGEAEFILADCYEHHYKTQSGKDASEIRFQWLNALGSSRLPAPLDSKGSKAFANKFGSRFKAIMSQVAHAEPSAGNGNGGEESFECAEEKKQSGAPPRKTSGAPPRKSTSATPRTSSQDECWDAYEAKNPCPKGKKPADHTEALGDQFWTKVKEILKHENEPSIQEWGQIADKLGL